MLITALAGSLLQMKRGMENELEEYGIPGFPHLKGHCREDTPLEMTQIRNWRKCCECM